jgi:predicted nucleotidyltransferase
MESPALFPTPHHQQAATIITDFFSQQASTEAVLLVNSCARGKATPESDLDMAILVNANISATQILALEEAARELTKTHPEFEAFRYGSFVRVHLDCFNGSFQPTSWDDGGGPDAFELEIGNRVAYSLALWTRGSFLDEIRATWLPYYDSTLQTDRLLMVKNACLYDIDHIAIYVNRGLYFQAFDRLYKAFQQFLQALFIANKKYPIAYNKWMHEQVEELLRLPALYPLLPPVLQLTNLESTELISKGSYLRKLIEEWIN